MASFVVLLKVILVGNGDYLLHGFREEIKLEQKETGVFIKLSSDIAIGSLIVIPSRKPIAVPEYFLSKSFIIFHLSRSHLIFFTPEISGMVTIIPKSS